MYPATEGPLVQPMSPPRARKENMALPPFLMPAAASEYVPGHISPTENPQSAMPNSDSTAEGENAMLR